MGKVQDSVTLLGWCFTEVLCIPNSFRVKSEAGCGARQRWSGRPVSLSRAHKAVLPTRVSYGVCFHVKGCKGGATDVGLLVINNCHL